jgi:AcrR family transcriptional regulator
MSVELAMEALSWGIKAWGFDQETALSARASALLQSGAARARGRDFVILTVYSIPEGCQGPMKPRRYRLGRRQATVEQTRGRIVAAARELLAAPGGFSAFTVDAVAAQAGVARMTVYNQFGSKIGLLEALFDDLAARGLVNRLRAAFGQPEPRQALAALIAAFGGFWDSDRVVIRRIRGLASIDPDFEQAVRQRDGWRREALRAVVGRLVPAHDKPSPGSEDEVIDVLHTLTSFETFDNLAGAARSPQDVVPLVCRLADAILEGLQGGRAGGAPDARPKRRGRRCP